MIPFLAGRDNFKKQFYLGTPCSINCDLGGTAPFGGSPTSLLRLINMSDCSNKSFFAKQTQPSRDPDLQSVQGPSPPAADSSAQPIQPCPSMTHWPKGGTLPKERFQSPTVTRWNPPKSDAFYTLNSNCSPKTK